jgi:hypothetical protein
MANAPHYYQNGLERKADTGNKGTPVVRLNMIVKARIEARKSWITRLVEKVIGK